MRVEVSSLRRRFGEVTALEGVEFELPPGRRVALVGPNGSGKSTLNRILVGLLGYEGRVALDGVCPREGKPEVTRQIAYLPQVAPQLGAPVRELVRALAALRGIPAADVATQAAALGLELEAVAARPLRGLSGGMRQKLLLAVALASPASLLVLDEPTGSLDPVTRRRFFRALEDSVGDATVVLCSHRLEEVRTLVDHVLVLEDGRLVHDGPAAAFLEACTAHVIEIQVEGDLAARWLATQGFRPGADRWWTRTASPEEKRSLLREMTRELGAAMLDLEVRPVEELDLSSAPSADAPDAASSPAEPGPDAYPLESRCRHA